MQDGKRKIPINLGSKGQGHNWALSALSVWHDNLTSFQRTAFIFYTYTNGTKKPWNFNFAADIQEWSKFQIYVDMYVIEGIFLDNYTKW